MPPITKYSNSVGRLIMLRGAFVVRVLKVVKHWAGGQPVLCNQHQICGRSGADPLAVLNNAENRPEGSTKE